ncbi:MAG TPA: homoserine dehydrogenase [Candidatus Limnocylindria bacterium]|nr:homoserine dehydrogenase [Candidatus Limnocylindria bacterium]
MRLALYGFGNVGQALARVLLQTKAPFIVTAIETRRGGSMNPAGLDLASWLAGIDRARVAMATMDPRTHGNFDPGMPWEPTPVGRLPADVLVEMTPLDPVTGEPALTYIREALGAGMHVVTANKGPIARAYRELDALATKNGRMLRFEATLADCLPVFTLRRAALPLAQIRAMRGIVSSTNNHILTAAAAGVSFADALAEAQRLGIAEADPRNDLEGHDAAAKATILANVLMDADLVPEDVSREPIDERAASAARAAAQSGDRVRPVIEIARRDGTVVASFGPRRLGPLDPLYAVDDFSMGLVFETDLAGRVAVQLHDPHVDQVAYAILTDLLEVAASRPAQAGTMPRP